MPRPAKHLTPEEYLILEEAAEFKSEYYQGEIFNMAGASISHNRIAMNLWHLSKSSKSSLHFLQNEGRVSVFRAHEGFRCQCSGVRKEKRKNCAVFKANAANLTPTPETWFLTPET